MAVYKALPAVAPAQVVAEIAPTATSVMSNALFLFGTAVAENIGTVLPASTLAVLMNGSKEILLTFGFSSQNSAVTPYQAPTSFTTSAPVIDTPVDVHTTTGPSVPTELSTPKMQALAQGPVQASVCVNYLLLLLNCLQC